MNYSLLPFSATSKRYFFIIWPGSLIFTFRYESKGDTFFPLFIFSFLIVSMFSFFDSLLFFLLFCFLLILFWPEKIWNYFRLRWSAGKEQAAEPKPIHAYANIFKTSIEHWLPIVRHLLQLLIHDEIKFWTEIDRFYKHRSFKILEEICRSFEKVTFSDVLPNYHCWEKQKTWRLTPEEIRDERINLGCQLG